MEDGRYKSMKIALCKVNGYEPIPLNPDIYPDSIVEIQEYNAIKTILSVEK
jgi:hypothetical protein